jgi:hypothetical protein
VLVLHSQNCSNQKILIPKVDSKKKQRICDKCYAEITEKDKDGDTLEDLPEKPEKINEETGYDSEDHSATASYESSSARHGRLGRSNTKNRIFE